jgi:hypothetical protein
MRRKLEKFDPDLVTLGDEETAVLVSPGLQGRIFCRLGGELIHRLDFERLEHPLPGEFNNLGGNSLWPAPEGGDFGFNYLPGSDRWLVQDDIGATPARLTSRAEDQARIAKTLRLKNRQGVSVEVEYSRLIRTIELEEDFTQAGGQAIAYVCTDIFEPLGAHSAEEVLIAPWSLEQFPGNNEVVAFGLVQDPTQAINFDFYGRPETEPVYGPDYFTLRLGGTARFQIGIKVSHQPRLIGALDQSRSLLIIRTTDPQSGMYFNIADNDQPAGPFSAADRYSVFSGGDLGFFELETIAPMQVQDGRVGTSQLVSRTVILKGTLPRLKRLLEDKYGVSI